MANHTSAKKRIRRNARRAAINGAATSDVDTLVLPCVDSVSLDGEILALPRGLWLFGWASTRRTGSAAVGVLLLIHQANPAFLSPHLAGALHAPIACTSTGSSGQGGNDDHNSC